MEMAPIDGDHELDQIIQDDGMVEDEALNEWLIKTLNFYEIFDKSKLQYIIDNYDDIKENIKNLILRSREN